jgi:hypothetical protein
MATQIMAIASINIGAAGTVTFAPSDTPFGQPPRQLPLVMTICQTDPTSGACMSPPTRSVTLAVAQNQTVTFTIFATRAPTLGNGMNIPYVPAISRVFFRAFLAGTPITPVGEASAAVLEQ